MTPLHTRGVHAFYLRPAPDPVLVLLHSPAASVPERPGVLLLPPFGWEEVCSYRARRAWAEHLAQAGHPVLRLDLPGTGDSGGSPRDPDRVRAWTAAVHAGADWLCAETGAVPAGLGIGLGGLLACLAVGAGAPLDQLVLWGVPARGRALVRELRAFGRLESEAFAAAGGPPLPPLPEGLTQSGGFVVTAETRAALERIDLTAAPAGVPAPRRALLLGRDRGEPDPLLRESLEGRGTTVTAGPGLGWAAMMEEPQDSLPPYPVFVETSDWLAADPGPAGPSPAPPAPPVADVARLGGVTERPLELVLPAGRLFGVLSEPEAEPRAEVCAVLLNAGAVRRIGPNRMWVELARRWAAQGVPTVRIDVEGMGDAEGDLGRHYRGSCLNSLEYVEQVRSVLDLLVAEELPARFVLVGLCAGSFQAFHAAREDERVRATLLVNPRALVWDSSLVARREVRRYRERLRPASWHRLPWRQAPARAGSLVAALLAAALGALRPGSRGTRRPAEEIRTALDTLHERAVRVLFAFGHDEPLLDELERDGLLADRGRWPNLEIAEIPGAVHTLRPLALQEHVHALLDSELARERARTPSAAARARAVATRS